MRSRGGVLLVVTTAVVSMVSVMGAATSSGRPAGAAVVRVGGFSGTVHGHRGWFGSYDLAGIGTVWCVDHGIAAPDADHRYLPAELNQILPATRTAMAWTLGRHGHGPDRVTAAALTLVLHDLMGAPYPAGRLDVARLSASDLTGFEGDEQAVLSRARAMKREALAHGHLRGPLTLSARADAVRPERPGVLVARLTDSAGAAVPGVELAATATGATLSPGSSTATDPRGEQRFTFVAAAGENRFHVSGVVPDLQLQSFVPSTRRAQRVATPGRVPVSAGLAVETRTQRLSIHKTGDASAYLPVTGARFEVRPVGGDGPVSTPVGELVIEAGGRSRSLELDPGRYQVTEVAAPAGYAPAGPWTADLTAADVVLEAANTAVPGRAQLTKADANTGRALAGATLTLAYDGDRDGVYEAPAGQWVSDAGPESRELRPGDYEVREVTPPPGYGLAGVPVRFSVGPGRVTPVTVTNAPLPAPVPTAPPSPTTEVTAQASPAPAARRPAREQPPLARLPET
ncbi:MAG: SpaA isopeptide-forming pilin-related protein, partial [Actinomycetota bacterium]|nr:SpaA isopeptide-forming pilin-related protein [Actinomycetota bacterium]